MGDQRTENNLKEEKIVSEERQVKELPKIAQVMNDFPVGSNSVPIQISDEDEIFSNESKKLDLMTRSLNFCRNVPCMGIIFALLSALFFGIAALATKFVPNVNPSVIVTFQ